MGKRNDNLRAEQSRAEQSRAEQSRAEQSRANVLFFGVFYTEYRKPARSRVAEMPPGFWRVFVAGNPAGVSGTGKNDRAGLQQKCCFGQRIRNTYKDMGGNGGAGW